MNTFHIRPARANDSPVLAQIYNHYIENTTITLETDPISAKEMERRRAEISQKGWYFVIEQAGEIKGYTYAKPWHERAGFCFTFESSIYLDPARDESTRGAGKMLYCHLLQVIENSGKVSVLLGVLSSENIHSAHFHEKLGFSRVAELQNVAFKFDHWLGILFYRLDFLPKKLPNWQEKCNIFSGQ